MNPSRRPSRPPSCSAPGESRTIPFVLAWDIPQAEFGVGTRWHRRYTSFFGTSGRNAWEIAATGARDRAAWAAAIDAWQAPILADEGRPDWYVGALFNELYFMVDGGTIWTDGPPMPADGWVPSPGADPAAGGPFGRFAQIECFDYPFYNTLDVDFYSSFARLQLWPELERAVIREFVDAVDVHDPAIVEIQWSGKPATRKCPGALPHDVGGPFDDPFLRVNAYRYQDINIWKDLNCKYVLQLWRDATSLDDSELLRDAWPSVVTALEHVARFDRDGDGLPEHDGDPDQTYDTWPMTGPSAYCGGLWLAALRAAIEIGKRVGGGDPDSEAAVARFAGWLETGTAAYESRLWTGTHYRYDDGGGASSDSIMADQLAGQWYADATGLGDVVAPDRVEQALRTVHAMNVVGLPGRRDGCGQRHQAGRIGRRVERAVARGLGRDDVRAGRVHAGSRARRRSVADGTRGVERHVEPRPLVPDAGGVRRERQLPGESLPPPAGDLGDRARARDEDVERSLTARTISPMPEIEYAFLADAAETPPGQKFHVLGGGVARIGGRAFPLRHPHLAVVIGLLVTAPETEREHEIRFVLLDPDGARGRRRDRQPDGPRLARRPRQHPDVLDRRLERDVPDAGRLLVPDPRQRLGAEAAAPRHHRTRCLTRPRRTARGATPGRPATSCRRSTRPRSSRRVPSMRCWPRLHAAGNERWVAFLAPLPDRLRDGDLRDLRSAALRVRAAFGPKDSIRDALPDDVTEPVIKAVDRLLKTLARHEVRADR